MKTMNRKVKFLLIAWIALLVGFFLLKGFWHKGSRVLPQTESVSEATKTDLGPSGETAKSLAQWLVRQGNDNYLSDRIQQALKNWEMAAYLDPQNRLAEIKLKKGQKVLEEKIENEYRQGLYAYKYLHFEQAIEHWQRVLRLILDPQNPRYQEAKTGIQRAEEQLKSS